MPKLKKAVPVEPVAQPFPRAALRVEEAAVALDLSRATLYKLMAAEELLYMKSGARRLIPMAEIDEFIARATAKQKGDRS